jgi:ABC-type phosphate transport system permease subunit
MTSLLIPEGIHRTNIERRGRRGRRWARAFFISNFIGLTVLVILILHVLNGSYGLALIRNQVEPETLSDRPLTELSTVELGTILVDNLGNRVRVVARDRLSRVDPTEFTTTPVDEVFAGSVYPEEYADGLITAMPLEAFGQILADNLSQGDLIDVVTDEIVKPTVTRSWTFLQSVLDRPAVEAIAAENPTDELAFRSWISFDFISSSVSSSATTTGLRTAILGSFFIMLVTIPVSLIIGVSAAIYLEEYAGDHWFNRVIEVNIRTLAGIPSVIYGMLGLAVFAQALSVLTGGYLFGQNLPDQNELQVTGYIREAVGLPALSAADGTLLVESIGRSIGETEAIGLMAAQIQADTISEQEAANLIRAFYSLRRPQFFSLNDFSTPSAARIDELIAGAIDPDDLNPDQLALLRERMRTYGTFNINGRTVVSAGLTLALLILPVIIVSSQEAVRAVPDSIREASYGLGATKWQTVYRQVLPVALPSVLTGVILAVSRAVGETAPLLVVGASTFIGIDPNGLFSKFTVVPIQIYQWTSRPEQEFRNVAAAAIIILLLVMLTMNAFAIYARNRLSRRF